MMYDAFDFDMNFMIISDHLAHFVQQGSEPGACAATGDIPVGCARKFPKLAKY
jgi:hypothetical protein